MSVDVDVLVVGGGLVGSSLAAALARSPVSLAVVEPVAAGGSGQPSFDDRCTALSPPSRSVFGALGLWEAIAPEATAIREIHVSERGGFGFARLRASEHGLEALGHVVPNRALGAALEPRLARQANLTRFCPDTVESVQRSPDSVEARLGSGETLRARLVVVADGADSRTRDELGIGVRRRGYRQAAVTANLTPALDHRGRAFERFAADGPLALLPLSSGRCALVRTVREEALEECLALDDRAFLADVQRQFGWRLGRLLRVGARSAYPLAALRSERFVAARAVVVGNAAHTLHPVAGQGFNLALRDVARLAETLHEAAVTGGDPAEPARLAGYERDVRSDFQRTTTLTDTLVHVFGSTLPGLAPLRSAGLLALDLCPPARRGFALAAMGRAGRLPALARGVPLGEAPAP